MIPVLMLAFGIGGVAVVGGAVAVQQSNARKAARAKRAHKHPPAKKAAARGFRGAGGGHTAAAPAPARSSAPARPARAVTGDDLAAYIVEKLGPLTPMKVMRIAYLCQAASYATTGRLIYDGTIKAGPTGPMPTDLFAHFKGKNVIAEVPDADATVLDESTRRCVDEVFSRFGDLDEVRLNEVACRGPWKTTRDAHLNSHGVDVIDPKEFNTYWNELTGVPSK